MSKETAVKDKNEVQERQRRTWTKAEKLKVVKEAINAGPGQGSKIATSHQIAPNLLYRWIADLKDEVEQPAAKMNFGTVQTEIANIRAEIEHHQGEIDKCKMQLADLVLAE